MAEQSDSPCSSDHDEYSDPLQIAARAGARLSTPEKAIIRENEYYWVKRNSGLLF